MYRKKPDVDIINDVLKASREAYPNSSFVQSLALQYEERGGLSKKQLEGLYKKAEKITDNTTKLAGDIRSRNSKTTYQV